MNVVSMGAVVKDKKILLIKRIYPPFKGLWALPAGHIEHGEHIDEATVREVKEETNIDSDYGELLGLISEHIIEKGNLQSHSIIFLSLVRPRHANHKEMDEGKVEWFDLGRIDSMKEKMPPPDYMMVKSMLMEKKGLMFRCIVEETGGKYSLKAFEKIS